MPRNTIAISFVLLIVIPTLAPPVFGEWESDSWLENVIGPERISLGDEFGCQGYEGVDINSDPWSIAACMDYLSEKSPSSRWGERPISFGLGGKETLPSTESAIIDALQELKKTYTIILIAHKHETLRFCDRIYEVKDGSVRSMGNYTEYKNSLIKSNFYRFN